MENDINNLDPNEEGLKKIFSDRFRNATQETVPVVNAVNKVQEPVRKQSEPVKPVPNGFDNLKSCAKSVCLFGGLSFLVFYWQQAGLMDSSVAVPTMCVCTALAGLGVGKNINR